MTDEPAPLSSSPWLSIWRRPGASIAAIVENDPSRNIFWIAGLAAVGSLLSEFVGAGGARYLLDWRIAVAAVLFAALGGILGLYVAGYFLRVCARPFGGYAEPAQVRAAVAWSQLPYLALAAISVPALLATSLLDGSSAATVASLFSAVGWIFGLWTLAWLVLMLARIQGFGFWRSSLSTAVGLLALLMVVVALALLCRILLFQPFSIPSASMVPTLQVGDYMFVSKYAYGYSRFSLPFAPRWFEGRIFGDTPRRGDIVVFALPRDERVSYVKRMIGLPGERIQMIGGRLHIDGKEVPRTAMSPTTIDGDAFKRWRETLPGGAEHEIVEASDSAFLDNTREFVVPAGHYFMMGDNRDNSVDSRVLDQVGFVPFENLIGRASFIYYSRTAQGEDPLRHSGFIK